MSDLYKVGDIVGAKKPTKLTRYNKGDIIAFTNKDGMTVIHQIVGTITAANGETQYRTKGLNNQEMDSDPVSKSDIIGKVSVTQSELTRILQRVAQGKTTLLEAFGMTENIISNQQKNVLAKIKDFKSAHPEYADKLENFVNKFEAYIEKDQTIERKDIRKLYSEIRGYSKLSKDIGDSKSYQDLMSAVGEIAPFIWLDSKFDNYFEQNDRKFQEYHDRFVKNLKTPSDPFYLEPEFGDLYDIQIEILLEIWGDRDAFTGKNVIRHPVTKTLYKYKNNPLIRHHYKGNTGGRNFFKTDCSIAALVPVYQKNHPNLGAIHTDPNIERFYTKVVDALIKGDINEVETVLRTDGITYTDWTDDHINKYISYLRGKGLY